MLVIEEVIKNGEEERISNVINELELAGCGETFCRYLNTCREKQAELSVVERLFYEQMWADLNDFCLDLYLSSIKTDKDYKEAFIDAARHGFCGYYDKEKYELLEEIEYFQDLCVLYNKLTNFMFTSLSTAMKKAEQSVEEKKEAEREAIRENIKRYENLLAAQRESLAKLSDDSVEK